MKLAIEPPRFDWYAATVEVAPGDLLDIASTLLADERPVLVQGRNGFAHGWELRREGSRSAVIYAGGAAEFPHIVGTGSDADGVARVVRKHLPAHQVARADVCVDTDTPGAFSLLLQGLRDVVGVATAYMIQPDRASDGATYYVGAKTSEVRARLYEKGRQLPEQGRPDWVRYEVQLRPQKERKRWAGIAPANDLLAASRWSRAFALRTLGIAATAPPTRSERVSDLEGAISAMCQQYGKRLLELLEAHGGDVEAFSLDLLHRAQNGGQKAS